MGTVFNRTQEAIAVLAATVAGLREEPLNLVVTVGRNGDPAAFGPQPPNVRIEHYIPHERLLPVCDLVVTHGGFNTVMSAFAHGLPLVAVPLGADQFRNAARCVAHGLGVAVEREDRTPEAIRAAVSTVLADADYRCAAMAMREQMAELPGPTHAVELLERLVEQRAPLLADGSTAPTEPAAEVGALA
jgi:MGT family glycosyltransferase